MTNQRNCDVWLGVMGLVIKDNKVLVVKKAYSKTKGLWTLPGGFVSKNETMDEAAVREVKEETNINTDIIGIIGARTGILKTGVSDNLILFHLQYISGEIKPRSGEIDEAKFLTMKEIFNDPNSTDFLIKSIEGFREKQERLDKLEFMPRRDYGYLKYKMFR